MTAFCALCVADIAGMPVYEPLGRDGALVAVCPACADEHPRSGRYSFDDAAKHPMIAHDNAHGHDRTGRLQPRKSGPK